jgi:hypothetical protein
MAVTIPPPHIPFALDSSYLLDALVPMPLPFIFLSPTSSLYGGLFLLFLGLFVPLFGSSGFWRFTALRLRQVFYAPPPCHSLIATFLSGVPARSRLSLIRLIILPFILCFLWFPYILFPLFIFCFAGFPCICFSIYLYCLFLFVLCVFLFLQFYRSSLLLFCRTPSTVGPFSVPPPRRASNSAFSVRGLLACDQFYFPVFLLFLLVISLVSINLLWGVRLGPDL